MKYKCVSHSGYHTTIGKVYDIVVKKDVLKNDVLTIVNDRKCCHVIYQSDLDFSFERLDRWDKLERILNGTR